MNRIKEIINEKGISQAHIARKLLVTRATVNLWVNKKSNPRKVYIEKLSKILGVNEEEIFFEKDVNLNANVNITEV